MAVKIKLKRLGKIREPYYRIVVADSRTKRDGRAIEEIGKYHPKLEPSLIQIDSERAQYWLSVGAQPTEPVQRLLAITGDWQKFKGLPGAEGTLKTAEPKADKKERYEELVKESFAAKEAKAAAKPARSSAPKRDARKAEAAPAETAEPVEAKSAEAKTTEAKTTEAAPVEANVTEAKSTEAKSAEAKSAEAAPVEAQAPEATAVDSAAADSTAADNAAGDSSAADSTVGDTTAADSTAAETSAAGDDGGEA